MTGKYLAQDDVAFSQHKWPRAKYFTVKHDLTPAISTDSYRPA